MKLEEPGTRSRPAVAEVSLVQLSADGATIKWPEAVAIISQICQFLLASGTQSFDASTIVVRQSGDVTLRTSTSGDAEQGVRALGELLRTCLSGTSHPVPLQNIIAQATSRPPFYRSTVELAEALSYYAGSKPQELTRSVYERWQSRHRAPGRVPVHARPRAGRHVIGRARLAMLALYTARPAWMTRRALSITTAILFSIGVAGIAFAAGLGRSAAPAFVAKIGRANGQATAAVVSTMGGAVEFLRLRFIPTASPPVDTAVDSRESQPESRRRARPVSRTAAAVRAIPSRRLTRMDGGTPHSMVPASQSVTPFAAAIVPLSTDTAETRHSSAPLELNESRLYSADDTDVTAPVPIDRIRSNPLAAFNRQQNAAAITIVVSEDGRVESATVVSRPATFRDSVAATMNLSAVKSWRFYPAVRAGRPVKYRTTVWLVDH
jgi:hypothetical protein